MTTTKNILIAICVFAAVVAAGCSSSETQEGAGTTTSAAGDASAGVLVGAGSTFVYPLVTEWIKDYAEAGRETITYGPIGSGGGIESISSSVVDFGASDAPLTPDQKAKCSGCVQDPVGARGDVDPLQRSGSTEPSEVDGLGR